MDRLRNITITIQPSGGKDRVLTVNDALKQILDIIEIIHAPSRLREVGENISWGLVKASTNSPLNVEIAPFGKEVDIAPHLLDEAVADASAAVVGLASIFTNREIPDWLDKSAGDAAKRLAKRNMNGIGITEISGVIDAPLTLNHVKSETILEVLDFYSAPNLGEIGKHQSKGEVSGKMMRVGEFYGKPAFWVLDKAGREVACTMNDQLVEQVGGQTTLEDVWKNRRLLIRGIKHYDKSGKLLRIEATSEPEIRDHKPVNLYAVIDEDFTGGLSATEYISKIRGDH